RKAEDKMEIQFDITKKHEFSKLWKNENFDIILHTIGMIDQTRPKKDIFAVNALGTKYMCEFAESNACKHLIFTSSVTVYGFKTLGENHTENNIKRKFLGFFPPYGRSKAIAEKYIEQSGLQYTILRLPMVLGRNDTFLTPSIIPRLLNGTIFTCGKNKKKISLLYVKNLGPIIEKLVRIGPLNLSFNCISDTIFWDDLVKQFAIELNVEYIPKKKNKLSFLFHSNDRNYQLIATHSAFGAHYSCELFLNFIEGYITSYNWKEGIKEAVDGYLE
ncbi:MAG: NAD-dependent epimerase/dehydratase family protein, partial [Candidatus Hermodarchaeota archaeon]